jgi:rhamnosyl/mannosyltransferase
MAKDNRIRVLHIYKDYYPPVFGGIENNINIICNGIKDIADVKVLVSNTKPKTVIEKIDGVEVTKVAEFGRIASAPLNLYFPLWLKRLGSGSEVLHFHFPNPTGEISYLLSGLKHKKVVVSYHSDVIRQAFYLNFYKPLLLKFFDKVDRILPTSPNYMESSPILRHFRYKCTVVPLGIDYSQFSISDDDKVKINKLKGVYRNKIILFIGKLRYYKGLEYLIKAMQNVDAKLLIIGSGFLRPHLDRIVADLRLQEKVVFVGEVDDCTRKIYLNACDVFVLPSIFRSEGFGIVQLEAMACGKPVVCTELGTGTSFVNQHGETGIVVPPRSSESLAEAINRLLGDETLRKKYGEAGRRRVEEQFSREVMVNKILRVYEEVLREER